MSEQRLIDANALIPKIKEYFSNYVFVEKGVLSKEEWMILKHNKEISQIIKQAPTVEERPKGEWIKPTVINGKAFSICHCSACGGVPCGVDENTKFCPNCGADMRGEGE